MDEITKKIYDYINNGYMPVNSINGYPLTKEQAVNFDIAKYLGLKGGLWGGQYNIEPQRPISGMIPVKLQYEAPMMGGNINFKYDLSPENKEMMINYFKRF